MQIWWERNCPPPLMSNDNASPGRIRPGDLRLTTLPTTPVARHKKSFKSSSKTAVVGDQLMRLTREDIDMAFKFLDGDDKGTLNQKDLKQKLEIFFPNFTTKEYKLLISEPNFTADTLWGLIQDNLGLVKDHDPAVEAFKTFDPESTGYLDPVVLRNIMRQMGYGEMSDEDLAILIQTADANKDGKIDITDFRGMLGFYPNYQKGGGANQDGDENGHPLSPTASHSLSPRSPRSPQVAD
ncbi:Calmodulin [Diplonema papillatum]|nr:Calmodulin [Diplonema papillatum]